VKGGAMGAMTVARGLHMAQSNSVADDRAA